ncbi:MAG: YciI family protein [Bacteroidota bacterium]|nr:YciI family protein [Bacteroidota bacterium]
MKGIYPLIAALLLSSASMGQPDNANYDPALAKSLGADEYGMKTYIFVILKTGSNNVQDKALRDSLFAGHMRNIRRLVDLKKLIVAGPFSENDNMYRGLFVLDVGTIEEAKELLNSDPTVREKVFEPILIEWYGPAALPEYLKANDKVWKIRR